MHKLKVLIADDMFHERLIIESRLKETLAEFITLDVVSVETAEEAVARAVGGAFPLVILDIDFSKSPKSRGMSGLEASVLIKKALPETYVTVVSSNEDAEIMNRAVDDCAVDWYLRRSSISFDELAWLAKRALVASLHRNGLLLEEKYQFITTSKKARRVLTQVDAILPTQNALIVGETGTGKELVARRIHANAKLFQPKRPLRVLDCASIPAQLFEGEVFGYKKGAFTGAGSDRVGALQMAHGGDLFLDEIHNIPIQVQQKLLRVLNDGVFSPLGTNEEIKSNFRVIAATNIPLDEAIRSGRLLADFVERIRKIRVELVPLRERPEDIEPLTARILAGTGSFDKEFADDAFAYMRSLPWPGNIRELKSFVESATQSVKVPIISSTHLENLCPAAPSRPLKENSATTNEATYIAQFVESLLAKDLSLPSVVQTIEDHYFTKLYERGQNVREVAESTGYNRNRLAKRLAELGLKRR
jgi:two-component system NtrC family response regulator